MKNTTRKKYKYLLFFAFFTVFTFLSINSAFALEMTYPNVPGLPDINTNKPEIGDFVGYFFGLLTYLAGVIALISFTVGAIGLISPSVEAHSAAKDRMKSAVLGLVLTMAAFIIIKTINPALITPTLTPLPGVAGVFYTNGSETKSVGISVSNTSERPTGFNDIIYKCSASGSGTGPTLLVWTFPQTGLEQGNPNYNEVKVKSLTCGETLGISGIGSFRMAWETPGIYYCLGGCGGGNMCSGYMSGPNLSSQDNISAPFSGKIGGVRIVNNSARNLRYGVIFHKVAGLANGGACNFPIKNTTDNSICEKVDYSTSTSAANIFTLNREPGTSGDGVSFYSRPFGELTGTNAGFLNIPDNSIKSPYYENSAQAMKYIYTGVVVTDKRKADCVTFKQCPESMKIKGSYLVALYSGPTSAPYCQTFQNVKEGIVPNLKAQPVVASGGAGIEKVFIIPTK